MTKNELFITENLCKIYMLLIGWANKNGLTQTQICKSYGYARSTVNDNTRKLVKLKFIKPKIKGARTDIAYIKGKNAPCIEHFIAAYKYYETNDQVDTHIDEISSSVTRVHLNGGWVDCNVIKEGQIYHFIYEGRNFTLFGKKPNYGLKGDVTTWNDSINVNKEWSRIRYIKSKKGKMVFGVAPKHQLMSVDGLEKIENAKDVFYPIVADILAILEKYAGWQFEKNECGNYNILCKAKLEYAMDESISNDIKEVYGDNLGLPGKTEYWFDKSDKSLGGEGEIETGRKTNVVDLLRLPETTAKVKKHENEIRDIFGRIEILENRINISDPINRRSNLGLRIKDEES